MFPHNLELVDILVILFQCSSQSPDFHLVCMDIELGRYMPPVICHLHAVSALLISPETTQLFSAALAAI